MHFLNKFLQKGFTIFFIFVSTTVLAQTKSLNQLFTLSTEAIQKGNFQLAAQFLQEIFKKDSNNIAALNNATYVYGKLKNYSSAIQCSKKLAALQPENANHFTNTGWFLLLNYEYEEAEMYCLKALEINNCSYINYLNLGHVYSFLKQYDKGVNYYYKALAYLPNKAAYESVMQDFDLFETNGNFPYKITNYKNMVVNYYNKSFLTMLHGTDVLDSIYQLTVLSNYLDSDEKVTALKEKFLIEENKNEYVRLEVLRDFYWSLGWMHLRNGSKSIAINNYFGSVLKISNDLKDTSFNIDVLYKLGLEYDLTAGLNLINQALTLANLSNNYNKQYIINLLLGDKYLDKQYPDSALIYFRKAYSLTSRAEVKDSKTVACNRLMLVFKNLNQYDSVTYYYSQIKKDNLVNPVSSANSLVDDIIYCSFLVALEKLQAAIQLGKEVIIKAGDNKTIDISGIYEQLGVAYAKQSKTDSAKYYFSFAINNFIQFIKNNPELAHNTPFKERNLSFYYLKKIALEENNITKLFDLSEQTRASILYPKLTGRIFSPESIPLSKLANDLKADEVALSFSNSSLTNIAYAIGITNDKKLLVKENNLLFDSLNLKHTEAKWLTPKARAKAVSDSLKNYNYEKEEINFNLNLVLIIFGGLNNMMQAGLTRGSIKLPGKNSTNYAAEILAYNDIIYQLYIKPFEKILAGKKTIYLSPDIATTLIPFEAIKNEQGEYLGNLYNIVYVPSFTSRVILKSTLKQREKLMLAAGNPLYDKFELHNTRGRAYDFSRGGLKSFANLPGTEKELSAIQQHVPSVTILEKSKLTETNLKNMDASGELGRYDILHFAVHGISSMEDYRDNTLIVSEIEGTDNDGFLQYNEIANLHLNADLVCLSACETAAGLPSEDEDVKNLPIAFFLAGAKAVIATWWKIDDEASGIFMSSFYRFVFKENKSYGEALLLTRQNFISGMYGERFKSPYYWAAFKFFGN